MIYLLKQYYRDYDDEVIKQTLVTMSEKEFKEFKQETDLISENCWYGESNYTGYDEDQYYSYYYLLEKEEM